MIFISDFIQQFPFQFQSERRAEAAEKRVAVAKRKEARMANAATKEDPPVMPKKGRGRPPKDNK